MRYSRAKAYRAQMILAVILSTIGLVALSILYINISSDLRQLRSASSDNVQWTLSQVEVEFLEFEIRLDHAMQASDPDLKAVRRSFDIFYSRIATLREASIFAPVRGVGQFSDNLAVVHSFFGLTEVFAPFTGTNAPVSASSFICCPS